MCSWPTLPCVLQAADVQGEQLRLADLGDHPGQLFLDQLMAGDRLVAKLLAQEGVLQRRVVAGHSCADGSPGDAVAGLVEAHERGLEAAGFGQTGWLAGTRTSCSESPEVTEARSDHLPWTS